MTTTYYFAVIVSRLCHGEAWDVLNLALDIHPALYAIQRERSAISTKYRVQFYQAISKEEYDLLTSKLPAA